MAGHKKSREAAAVIKARWDDLLAELNAGKSLKNACIAVGVASEAGLMWLMRQDSALAEEVARARKLGAAALASQTLDIADELAELAPVDPLRSAEQRIKVRQWLAGKLDRENYGEQPKAAVTVNIAGLHLDALRRQQPARLDQDVIEGEIVQALPAPLSLDDIL